jgi:hypothetical protein
MSKNPQASQQDALIAAAAGVLPGIGAIPVGGTLSPSQELLAQLLARKLQRQLAQEDEAEDTNRKAREAGARTMQMKRDQETAKQNACPHLKPNFQSALAGQRTHQHNYVFICQYCACEFDGNDLMTRPHLRIPMDRIGGPNY